MYKYRHTETYKGKRIDIRANSKKEIFEKLEKRKKAIDKSRLDTGTKLKDFCDMYIDVYKAPVVSEKWLEGLKLISNKHIVGELGNRPISSIKLLEVQEMLNTRNVSNNYIGKIYNLTCQIFHHAYKNGLTDIDYSEEIEKPKGTKAKTGKRLTQEEQDSMLKVIKGHRAETLCSIMYYCGLRTGEARSLLWKDIDLDNRLLYVHGTKTDNADRVVPIPLQLIPLLKAKRGKQNDNVCISDKQQAEKAWRNVKRLMNIDMGCELYRNKLVPPYKLQDDLRLYDLRHTYCTNLELQGVPLSIASRLMGHSSVGITANIYTHETDEAVELAMKIMDGSGKECGKNRSNTHC